MSPRFVVAGRAPAATRSGRVLFDCQSNTNPAPVKCYGPDQIRVAYGVQTLLNRGINGSGKTIVIVDAFGSPTIAQDLHIFDQAWGLPDPTLNVIAPDDIGTSDPENLLGWAIETSLDVEWAHVIAPNAAIDLVIAKSNDDADILSALTYAVSHNLGDTISMSFGEAEQCMNSTLFANQHALFQQALAQKITLFASSGDLGAAQPTCDMSDIFKAASTPASDPDVAGVGGTSLRADAVTGYYFSERVWNEYFSFGAAGGGGFSSFFAWPSFEASANIYSSQRGSRTSRTTRGSTAASSSLLRSGHRCSTPARTSSSSAGRAPARRSGPGWRRSPGRSRAAGSERSIRRSTTSPSSRRTRRRTSTTSSWATTPSRLYPAIRPCSGGT